MKLEESIQQSKFGSEGEKLLLNVVYTAGWIGLKQLQFFKDYDISPQQYNVLRILRGQYPTPVSVSVIQERMLDRMSNASRLIEKLKQKNLVSRKECKVDRRQVDIIITEQGLAFLKEIDVIMPKLHQCADTLNIEEKQQLNNLLDKLRTKQTKN